MTEKLHVRNPRTGQTDQHLDMPDRAEMAAVCGQLRAGQAAWQAIGLDGRIKAMLDLCAAVDRHYDAILAALTTDTGRHAMSLAEIEGLKGITQMNCASAPAALREASGPSGSDASLRFRQQYVPQQLVGVISPWNYPLILSMIDAIPALLAGSAVAIKPSEITPRFIVPFRAAIAEIPLLRDVLALFVGDGRVGGDLIDLTDMVVFTGSVPTGRRVQERAASQFKLSFLELGGNDAAVVLNSADADQAAEIIVRGAVENSGQLCCAIERVYVQAAMQEDLTRCITARMKALTLNLAAPAAGELGPIILARQAEVLRDQLADAVAKGAKILCGGRILEHEGGLWCEPTVLIQVTQDMKIMREETFGSIVPIAAFTDEDEAVRLANDTDFGLSATVIGAEDDAIRLGERLNAGGVWINDFDTMGGVGDRAEKTAFGISGLGGTRYGPGGFMRFLRKKALVIRAVA